MSSLSASIPWGDATWHRAVTGNDLTTVQTMVVAGWPLNRPVQESPPGGRCALGLAMRHNDHAMVGFLLDAGADVHHQDLMGITPLMDACFFSDNAATVARLIAAGSDVNAVSWTGLTPLHWAARQGRADLVDLLLNAGADPFATTPQGESAMSMAMAGPTVFHTAVADRLRNAEVRTLQAAVATATEPRPSVARPRL